MSLILILKKKQILKAIKKALSEKFKYKIKNLKNPYEKKKINLEKIGGFILKSCKNSKKNFTKKIY